MRLLIDAVEVMRARHFALLDQHRALSGPPGALSNFNITPSHTQQLLNAAAELLKHKLLRAVPF